MLQSQEVLLKKIKERTAEKIGQGLKFHSEDAKNLLTPVIKTDTYFNLLLEKKFYIDAIRFLAHGLPKREAVWWGCVCVRSTLDLKMLPEDLKAVEIAEKWVQSLSEEDRLSAKKIADSLELKTAASWVAMAAFWSQGSITPLNTPVVWAPETLSAQAVAGAILLVAVIKNPDKADFVYENFLNRGVNIANGGNGEI